MTTPAPTAPASYFRGLPPVCKHGLTLDPADCPECLWEAAVGEKAEAETNQAVARFLAACEALLPAEERPRMRAEVALTGNWNALRFVRRYRAARRDTPESRVPSGCGARFEEERQP